MSRLDLYGRPWVVFDPTNKDHRRWFAEFQEYHTWGRCPVRFIVDQDHGELVTMIQRSLIDYYVRKEFTRDQILRGNKPRKKYVPKNLLP